MGIHKFFQVYVAWGIKMRNKLIFENQQMSIQKILPRILGFFHDYLKQKKVQSTTHYNLSFGIPSGHLWFLRWSSIKWKLWWRCYYLFPQKNLDAELSEYGVGFQRKSIASSLLGSSSGCWFPEGGLNSCARRFSECDWMAPRKTSTSSGRSPVLEGENQISQRSLSIHLFPTCWQRVQLQGWCFL